MSDPAPFRLPRNPQAPECAALENAVDRAHVRQLKSAHLRDIALFPGTGEMLRALKDGGLRLALVSSDHEANARQQLGETNAALFSDFACGASIFGKAAHFRRVLKRAGVDPARAVAIGDEVRDIEAARAVGIAAAAVTWGYAAPEKLRALSPDWMFERMEDIAPALCARIAGKRVKLLSSVFTKPKYVSIDIAAHGSQPGAGNSGILPCRFFPSW